jgi:hypothetical protein
MIALSAKYFIVEVVRECPFHAVLLYDSHAPIDGASDAFDSREVVSHREGNG